MCVSTGKVCSPKAWAITTLAVLLPTPGSATRASKSRGTSPPCSSHSISAARFRAFALAGEKFTCRMYPRISSTESARIAAGVGAHAVPPAHGEPLFAFARGVLDATAGWRSPSPGAGDGWARAEGGAGVAASAERDTAARTRKIGRLIATLESAFLERGPIVRAALLALLSGQHTLLIGPPGTAKSMLARALCACVEGGDYFEY